MSAARSATVRAPRHERLRQGPKAQQRLGSRTQSLDPEQLLERVRQLERHKQADEKERKNAENKQKKDLATAKNAITVEVRAASRLARKSEMEASKLSRNLQIFEQKAEQARAKRIQQIDSLELEASKAEFVCTELRAAWEEKLLEIGSAKANLANAALSSKLLDLGVLATATSPAAIADRKLDPKAAALADETDRLHDENARLDSQVIELRKRLDSLVPPATQGSSAVKVRSSTPSWLSSGPVVKTSVSRWSSGTNPPPSSGTGTPRPRYMTIEPLTVPGPVTSRQSSGCVPSRQASLGAVSNPQRLTSGGLAPQNSFQSVILRTVVEGALPTANSASNLLGSPCSGIGSATTTPGGVAPSAILRSPRSPEPAQEEEPVLVYAPWMARLSAAESRFSGTRMPGATVPQPWPFPAEQLYH